MLGTGPDPEMPDNDSKWVDEGGSVTISTLGKNVIVWCGVGGWCVVSYHCILYTFS